MSKPILAKNVRTSQNRLRILEYAFVLGLSSILAGGVIDHHNATMRDAAELSKAVEFVSYLDE